MSRLDSLNEAQRRAVTSDAPTVAILAGPGSGKTHTLTSRVVWLVQQANYTPSDIVVATFTVKAAREMKVRIAKALGEELEKKIILGTFHSIARRYLAKYGRRIGLDSNFGIADDGDSRAIIQRICKRLSLQIEAPYARSWISKKKAKGTTPPPAQPGRQNSVNAALQSCYDEYQAHLTRANLLDYDDLLVYCVQLLQDHPSCVSNIQAVLIDEYQDTNGIQYDLMKLFAQARHRITIVGDPDQSIYGWRSAEIRNLYRLLRDYPKTDEVSLEENYRSSQWILDMSLNVIQQDKKRYQKRLVPVHTRGARPVLRKLKSSAAEGEWIVSEIRRAVMLCGAMLKFEDVAILLRSASLSRHIESALGKAGVAYRMVGGHKFYDRKEIKVLLDYLRVIQHPDNNDALARVINVPRRGIGETTIKSLLEEAEQAKISLWKLLWRHCREGRGAKTNIRAKMEQKLNTELLRITSSLRKKVEQLTESSPLTLVDLIEDLVHQLDFKKYLQAEYAEDHEGRWANVQELVNLAGDFTRDFGKPDEEALPEIEGVEQAKDDDLLSRFLANVALASDAQKDGGEGDKASLVTISTIHAAKGLEWPIVFVPSVYTGSIPHSRAEDSDEERRLLYVAMTRAQALLYLSCPLYGSQGTGNKVELSPFVSPFAGTLAPQGPSFDGPVLEGIANILGRVAPTDKTIYAQVPPMFSPEDDLFPIDPFDPKNADGIEDGSGHLARTSKRQRTVYSNNGEGGDEEEKPWRPDYLTTMESASEFTMSSLPGFVSAGAHHSALAAAAAIEQEKAATIAKQGPRTVTCRRRPDQRSLLGFVTQEPRAQKTPPPKAVAADLSLARYRAAASRHAAQAAPAPTSVDASKPGIDPALAHHRLPQGRTFTRPNALAPRDDNPRQQYACFSSPPPRPPSPDKAQAKEEASATEPLRPAASFHTTTFMSSKPLAGVRRPASMGPPPSMDRLRKPFKPLTMSRPGGPGR
ncbi:AAA domain-containing protein [Hirsutella rhossiliensis]|uniref:DNA 3'-5' helicase n=1 Tax=Hirsutella rhossiliensis TaxID=111463 RepID=A0A9P8MVA1_9HYPO|nr:AAA domain-containing protein [Hirsutella rhossiliensis]KAH0961672.1 AAA domain-containing protein [Hirsutella rhossiliensis]